ncbi:PREDICTED: zinc finger protein 488 [Miniopterus natalensis]|uniref:zinc finger protein 488 n=1 Tax=Miniopterus natalensis TaxID=291302 RepID=UPI0007A6EC6D|nr:PREDICTED: zinc finger protein 488 [Miniopterus natalensis]
MTTICLFSKPREHIEVGPTECAQQLFPETSRLEFQSPEDEDDNCWSFHLAELSQALLVNMAAGKGVLWSPSAENRWWCSEPEQSRGCQPVLPQKKNHPGSKADSSGGQDESCVEVSLSTPQGKLRLEKPLAQKVCWEQGQSAFMEVPRLKERLQGMPARDREHDGLRSQPGLQQLAQGVPGDPTGSTVFSLWPSRAGREQRSAFSKPARCPSGRPGSTSLFQAGKPADALGELLGLIKMVDIPCWGRLSNAKILVGDFLNLQTLPQSAPLCSAFLGAPTLWLKHAMAQVPTASPPSTGSQALLPPTFTFLGLSTQNWCAKCSLSFHLTSDLVFHMRSHHKKEHAEPDPHSKKPTEEALTCPICQEHFRERHHLSRHMASHR